MHVVDVSECRTAFTNAHRYVIMQLGGSGMIMRKHGRPMNQVRDGWINLLGVRTSSSQNRVIGTLQFESEDHYLLWLLKWQ